MTLRLTKNIYLVSKLLSRTSHSGFRGQASRQFSEFITKSYGSSQGISVDLLLEVLVIQLYVLIGGVIRGVKYRM